jgi:chromate transporter
MPEMEGHAGAADGPGAVRARPASLADLFCSFTVLSMQGFGGVLAVVQRELVERKRWLSNEEFIEEWAVAQIMPGPNVVNLSLMIGSRYFGLGGAIAALAGLLALPLVLILVLAVLHARYGGHASVAGALRGMAAVSAGLIAAVGLRMWAALARNPLPAPWCAAIAAAAFGLLAWVRAPLALVLLPLGILGCLLAWRRLAP